MQKQTVKASKDKGSRWIAKAAEKNTTAAEIDAGASAAMVAASETAVQEISACYGRSLLLSAKVTANGSSEKRLDEFLTIDVHAREGSEAEIDNQKFKFTRPLFSCPESVVWHCDVIGGQIAPGAAGDKSKEAKSRRESNRDAAKSSKASKKKSDERQQQETKSDSAAAPAASSSAKVAAEPANTGSMGESATLVLTASSTESTTPGRVADSALKLPEPSPLKLELACHVDNSEPPARTPKSAIGTPTADLAGGMTPTLSGGMTPSLSMGGMPDPAMMAHALAFQNAYLQSMTMGFGAMPPPPAPGAQGLTTVMLRNIPNRYSREMLVDQLNQKFRGKYDFLYLPIDFNSKCNVGYAFINFRTPAACQRFFTEYHNKRAKVCLPGFSSMKVCEVSHARVQGRDANMDNLCDDKFIEKLNEHVEWQPLFIDDQGREIPFSKTVKESKQRRQQAANQHKASAPSRTPYPGMVHPMAAMQAAMSPHAAMPSMMYPPSAMSQSSMKRLGFGDAHPEPVVFLPALLPHASGDTVAVLRSVPSRLSRHMFLQELTRYFYGKFDCIFLPGNTKGDGNRRFAFINFRSRMHAQSFVDMVNSKEGTIASSQLGGCEATKSKETFMFFEQSLRRLWADMLKQKAEASSDWQPLLINANNEPIQPALVDCWGAIGNLGASMMQAQQMASMASMSAGAAMVQTADYAKQMAERALGCLQVDGAANSMSQQQAYMQSMSQQNYDGYDGYDSYNGYDPQMYYSGMEDSMCMEDYSSWCADGGSWYPQYGGAMA